VILITETHLNLERLIAKVAYLQTLGWRVVGSIASYTGRSEEGTSGGTFVITRSHVAVNDVPVDESRGDDWTMQSLKLKGLDVDVYSLYLTHTIGYTAENIVKLTQVATSVKARGNEFLIMADCHAPGSRFMGMALCHLWLPLSSKRRHFHVPRGHEDHRLRCCLKGRNGTIPGVRHR